MMPRTITCQSCKYYGIYFDFNDGFYAACELKHNLTDKICDNFEFIQKKENHKMFLVNIETIIVVIFLILIYSIIDAIIGID